MMNNNVLFDHSISRLRIMRIILFYDLPTKTSQERKIYSFFHALLLKNGFYMIQFSIYARLTKNLDFAHMILKKIEKNTPPQGDIRCLIVTEKQYEKIKFFRGSKSAQEKIIGMNPILEI